MKRSITWLLIALLLGGSFLVAPAAGQVSFPVIVNLRTAQNHGCSDDVSTPWLFGGSYPTPDFKVDIISNGVVVHTSQYFENEASPPWFELAEFRVPVLPATVRLHLMEAEPGATARDTVWVTCDIDPGPGEQLEVTIPVDGAVEIDSKGNGANAARIWGKAAPAATPHPSPLPLTLIAAPTCLHITWQAPQGETGDVTQTLVRDGHSQEIGTDPRRYDWCGLAERSPHSARLIRSQNGWIVAKPTVGATTTNAAPPPPEVTVTGDLDEFNLTWSTIASDLKAVDVYCSDHSPVLRTPSKKCATGNGTQTRTISFPGPGRVHLDIVATDLEGAENVTSTFVDVGTRPAPPAPTGVHVIAEHRAASFRWDVPLVRGLKEHTVVLRQNGTEVLSGAAEMPANETRLTGLIPQATYELVVTAVNTNGLRTSSAPLTFRYDPPNAAPTLNASVDLDTPRTGQRVIARVEASDADNDHVETTVDWGDGSAPSKGAGRMDHRYTQAGPRDIIIRATDVLGAMAEMRFPIDVIANSAPEVELALASTDVATGDRVRANVQVADPDGDTMTVSIDWGDGALELLTVTEATHIYARPGTFAVNVTARDPWAATAWATRSVIVRTPASDRGDDRTSEAPRAPGATPTTTTPSPSPQGDRPERDPWEMGEVGGDDASHEIPDDEPIVERDAATAAPEDTPPKVVVPGAGAMMLVVSLGLVLLVTRRPRER